MCLHIYVKHSINTAKVSKKNAVIIIFYYIHIMRFRKIKVQIHIYNKYVIKKPK